MKKIFILLFLYLLYPTNIQSQDITTIPPTLEADSSDTVLYHNENLKPEHLEHYKNQSYKAKLHAFSFYNRTQIRVNNIDHFINKLSKQEWSIEEDASDTIYVSKEFQGDYHGFLIGRHWEEKCQIDLIYYKKDNTTYIIHFKNIKHLERRKSDQEWSKKDVSEEKCLELIKIK